MKNDVKLFHAVSSVVPTPPKDSFIHVVKLDHAPPNNIPTLPSAPWKNKDKVDHALLSLVTTESNPEDKVSANPLNFPNVFVHQPFRAFVILSKNILTFSPTAAFISPKSIFSPVTASLMNPIPASIPMTGNNAATIFPTTDSSTHDFAEPIGSLKKLTRSLPSEPPHNLIIGAICLYQGRNTFLKR